jgi:hypothetical protein
MFKNINGNFTLAEKTKKSKWLAGSPEKLAEILNECEEKGHEAEVRFNLVKIDTEDDSEEVIPEAGIYRLNPGSYSRPESLDRIQIIARNYPAFPQVFSQLDEELEWFINNPNFFSNIGIRRSRSVLLWGPPGYSKTAKIHDLVLKNTDKLVLFLNSSPSSSMVEALNKIKLDKIIIFEEFATAVNNDSKISAMLNFLDGDNSLNDAFFIITTNHPEMIPKNVLRPSRVDRFIKIDKLSSDDIQKFLHFYLKRDITPEEISIMRGQSLANLREICISSKKESLSLLDAVKFLKSREDLLKKDFANERKLGIMKEDDDFPY